MVVVGVDHLVMDWSRSARSDDETETCDQAFHDVLNFFMRMESVAKIYASKREQHALRDVVSLIVLNVIDGYVINLPLFLSQQLASSAAGIEWPLLSKVANALHAINLCALTYIGSDGDQMALTLAGPLAEHAPKLKAAILDHSQPLDVHRWSDHPESNAFVDAVYEQHFEGGNTGIRKKHLKVVLLDLYVRWSLDPIMKTAVSMNRNRYDTDSRYNALHLSHTTIVIVKCLAKAGLVHMTIGFHRETGGGKVTRIWPTDTLISLFGDAKFGPMEIGRSSDQEVIILRAPHPDRPNKQIDIEYTDDGETNGMRDRLRAYNNLINRTFVDIPTLDTPFIKLDNGHRLPVSQSDKFTHRVFNRASFEKGGRFYGGWWQRCPEQARMGIFLNDQATVEVDYSGLHMVILYANKGIDYWREIGSDPYELHVPAYGDGFVPRSICKLLVLVALNAKDETTTFRAFRSESENGSEGKGISDGRLRVVLGGLRVKHQPIADMFASDAGINLMNQDGQITDRILSAFTKAGIPILSIHDSYIVPVDHAKKLRTEMTTAFAEVTGQTNVRVEPSRVLHPGNTRIRRVPSIPRKLSLSPSDGLTPKLGWQDGNDLLFPWANPVPSQRYSSALTTFRTWQEAAGVIADHPAASYMFCS